MLRKLIPALCLSAVLAFALAGCGSTNTNSSNSNSSESPSASAPAEHKDFDAKYTNDNGGITLAAVLELNGPDLKLLLEQQGYEMSDITYAWTNPTTEDRLEIRLPDNTGDNASPEDFEAATNPGDLAKGMVSIRSYDYDLSEISEEMYASIRESMMPGYEVESIKYLAFGGECWAIVNGDGGRFLLEIGAYDEHTATVRLETDAWAAADDMGSIDEIFN